MCGVSTQARPTAPLDPDAGAYTPAAAAAAAAAARGSTYGAFVAAAGGPAGELIGAPSQCDWLKVCPLSWSAFIPRSQPPTHCDPTRSVMGHIWNAAWRKARGWT